VLTLASVAAYFLAAALALVLCALLGVCLSTLLAERRAAKTPGPAEPVRLLEKSAATVGERLLCG
jgi:hypothetical protein